MTDRELRITDEEARELWRRAAELQAAAQRAERGSRAIAPVDEHGLTLEQVSAAAEGAGIDADYVRLALAEQRLPDADAIRRDRWTARWLRRMLGNLPDALEVSHSINAAPVHVLEAVRTVFPRPPFELALEDSVGDDPAGDGVLVYRLVGPNSTSSFRENLDWADARVLLTTIRADHDGARLRLRVPLFRRGINLALASGFTGSFAAGGTWGGALGGVALASMIGIAPIAVILLPAVLGAVAGGATGAAAYRGLYRWATRGAEPALHRLIQAVLVEVETPLTTGGSGVLASREGEA